MMIRIVWRRNDRKRVPRRRGRRCRVRRVKNVVPVKKAVMEMRDLSQPQGLLVGWEEAPRPRKTVFPVAFLVRVVDELSMDIEECRV